MNVESIFIEELNYISKTQDAGLGLTGRLHFIMDVMEKMKKEGQKISEQLRTACIEAQQFSFGQTINNFDQ